MADEFLTREKPPDRTHELVTAEMGTAHKIKTSPGQPTISAWRGRGRHRPASAESRKGLMMKRDLGLLQREKMRLDVTFLGGNTPVHGTGEAKKQNRTQDRTPGKTIQPHGIRLGENPLQHVVGEVDNQDQTQDRTPGTTYQPHGSRRGETPLQHGKGDVDNQDRIQGTSGRTPHPHGVRRGENSLQHGGGRVDILGDDSRRLESRRASRTSEPQEAEHTENRYILELILRAKPETRTLKKIPQSVKVQALYVAKFCAHL